MNSRWLWLVVGASGLLLVAILFAAAARDDDVKRQAIGVEQATPGQSQIPGDSPEAINQRSNAPDLIHAPTPLGSSKSEALLDEVARQFKVGVKQTIRPTPSPERKPFALDPSDGPAVAAAIEAFEHGGHPERLSPTVLPAKFDVAKFRSDPESYINVSEPGRVWQAAQPGPEVTPLRRKSPFRSTVKQGESIRLQVRAAEGAPVSFTCFDIGMFGNRLTSQTVVTSSEGVAEVIFTAFPGRFGEISIFSASPLHSGRLEFLVQVPQESGSPSASQAESVRRSANSTD